MFGESHILLEDVATRVINEGVGNEINKIKSCDGVEEMTKGESQNHLEVVEIDFKLNDGVESISASSVIMTIEDEHPYIVVDDVSTITRHLVSSLHVRKEFQTGYFPRLWRCETSGCRDCFGSRLGRCETNGCRGWFKIRFFSCLC